MAKGLLVLVLITGAAFFINRQANLKPSEEEAMVVSVRERNAVAVNTYLNAVGRLGAIGMETTLDPETAAAQVLKLRSELARLRKTLTETKAIRKADELAKKIENFCRINDIIRP